MQTSFALDSVKDTLTTVDAMKGAHKALKTEVKKVKIDDIEVIFTKKESQKRGGGAVCDEKYIQTWAAGVRGLGSFHMHIYDPSVRAVDPPSSPSSTPHRHRHHPPLKTKRT